MIGVGILGVYGFSFGASFFGISFLGISLIGISFFGASFTIGSIAIGISFFVPIIGASFFIFPPEVGTLIFMPGIIISVLLNWEFNAFNSSKFTPYFFAIFQRVSPF